MCLELWKDIPGYEGKYQISSLGRVKSLDRVVIRSDGRTHHVSEKLIRIFLAGEQCGRTCVQLNNKDKYKDVYVADTVAQVFLGAEPGSIIYHIDGNIDNNAVDNLSLTAVNNHDDICEEWRPVIGYEDIYEVSNKGNLRSITRKINHSRLKYNIRKELSHSFDINNYDYISVGLWRDGKCKQRMLHRLVAQAFIPNPDNKPFVNHIDGNRRNNNVSNLEWCTAKENSQHAIRTGLNPCDGKGTKIKCIELNKVYSSIQEACRQTKSGYEAIRRSLFSGKPSSKGLTYVRYREDS